MTPQTPRRRQLPALVISSIALFAALGGAAVALPGKDTVNSGDIKNNTVKSIDLKDGKAVSTDDVIDQSLSGADIADGSVAGEDVADDSIASEDIADNTLTGGDVLEGSLSGGDIGNDTVTGDDVVEATLGQVPNAATLNGTPAPGFVRSAVTKRESAVAAGTDLGDGTFYIDRACAAGETLLSGGPANVNPTSDMVESFPTPGSTNSWRARIDKNAAADNFSVVVLCAG